MSGPGTVFKREVLRRPKNAMLSMVFTNNRAILLIFYAKFTESILEILLNDKSTMVGPGKNFFIIKVLRRLKIAIFRLAFASTVPHKRAILLIF